MGTKTQLAVHLLVTVLLLGSLSGCPWDDPVTKFVNKIDDTVDAITVESDQWQTLVSDLAKNIPKEVQTTIGNELQNLVSESIGVASGEIRCDVDFVVSRIKVGLERIKAKLLRQNPPSLQPALCQVVPLAVDASMVPARLNKVSMLGYNLSTRAGISAIVLDAQNNVQDVSSKLNFPTSYAITLHFGANGVSLTQASQRIVLKVGDTELSTIAIIQPATPACRTMTVPHTPEPVDFRPKKNNNADGEFDGNGPHIWAKVTYVVTPEKLLADVYMRARETGDAGWRDSPSEAKGTKRVTLFSPDDGWIVESVLGDQYSFFDYVDTTESDDSRDQGSGGPVLRWVFVGDTQGSDIGKTGVNVTFNPLRIVVTENRNCISEAQVSRMAKQKFISEGIERRFRTAYRNFERR